MKQLFFILLLTLSTFKLWAEDPDSVSFVNGKWKIMSLEKGAVAFSARIQMFNSVQSISVIRYPSDCFRTEILSMTGDEADKTSRLGRKAVALFAINGSYFNMEHRTNTVYLRIGDDLLGETMHYEMYRVNGIIGINNSHGTDILITHCNASQYDEIGGSHESIMAAGPILIYEGSISVPSPHDSGSESKKSGDYALVYNQRHPRSVIGTDNDGNIYMVAIDGRFKRKAHGTTMWETARICELLGIDTAINLDGGGSSTLWSRKAGILNHPCQNRIYNHRGERKVPNVIVAL